MRWQNKVSLTEAVWAWSLWEIRKEETDFFEDYLIFAGASYTTLGIWAPEFRTAARISIAAAIAPYAVAGATALAVPLAIGTVAAYRIGGAEGLEDYYEFLTEPTKWKSRTEESLGIIKEEVLEPQLEDAKHGFNWIMGGVSNWAERQLEKAKATLPAPF
jgi:hypothetical protein